MVQLQLSRYLTALDAVDKTVDRLLLALLFLITVIIYPPQPHEDHLHSLLNSDRITLFKWLLQSLMPFLLLALLLN